MLPEMKTDILAEFDDFVIVAEVTLQSGKRQYMVESEPVVDHVGIYQKAEKLKSATQPVYGLFIAPKIVMNTINYFFFSSQNNYDEYGGNVIVIPFTLERFLELIELSGTKGGFEPQEIKDLFERCAETSTHAAKPSEWPT